MDSTSNNILVNQTPCTSTIDAFLRDTCKTLQGLEQMGVHCATMQNGDVVQINHEKKTACYAGKGAEVLLTATQIQITLLRPDIAVESAAQALRQPQAPRTQMIAGAMLGTTQPRFSELESSVKAAKSQLP